MRRAAPWALTVAVGFGSGYLINLAGAESAPLSPRRQGTPSRGECFVEPADVGRALAWDGVDATFADSHSSRRCVMNPRQSTTSPWVVVTFDPFRRAPAAELTAMFVTQDGGSCLPRTTPGRGTYMLCLATSAPGRDDMSGPLAVALLGEDQRIDQLTFGALSPTDLPGWVRRISADTKALASIDAAVEVARQANAAHPCDGACYDDPVPR